jgi:hypothetical protein
VRSDYWAASGPHLRPRLISTAPGTAVANAEPPTRDGSGWTVGRRDLRGNAREQTARHELAHALHSGEQSFELLPAVSAALQVLLHEGHRFSGRPPCQVQIDKAIQLPETLCAANLVISGRHNSARKRLKLAGLQGHHVYPRAIDVLAMRFHTMQSVSRRTPTRRRRGSIPGLPSAA